MDIILFWFWFPYLRCHQKCRILFISNNNNSIEYQFDSSLQICR